MASAIPTSRVVALLAALSVAGCRDTPTSIERSLLTIAFLRTSNTTFDLMLVGEDGRGLTRLAGGGSSLAWSPDGKELALGSYDNLGIDLIGADGSNRRTIVRGHVGWPGW